MTYQEFCELRQELTKAESEYLTAWKECKSARKKGKRLARLANRCQELNDAIMSSQFFK